MDCASRLPWNGPPVRLAEDIPPGARPLGWSTQLLPRLGRSTPTYEGFASVQFSRLADGFARARWWLFAAAALLTLVAIGGALRIKFDDVPRAIFRSDDAEFASLEQLFREFGSDDADCVLVVESDDLFTPQAVASLVGLVEEIRAVPGIASVQSLVDIRVFHRRQVPRFLTPLTRRVPQSPVRLLPPVDAASEEFARARREALAHPLVAGQLLSADGRTTLIVARLAGDNLPVAEIAPVVEKVRSAARRCQRETGLAVRMTGVAPVRAEIFAAVRRESFRFLVAGATLAFLMAVVLFRRLGPVLIVGGAAVAAAAWTMGGLGLVGEPMNVITTILPTLVMVIGFADAVHLMTHIRQSRAAGLTPLEASRGAIQHLGLACLLASLTTAVGFGSLAVAEVETIQRFGVVCAAGALISFVAVLLLVPLLGSTRLGRHVHLPGEAVDLPQRLAAGCEPLVAFLVRHRRPAAALVIAGTVALGAVVPWLQPSNQLSEALPTASESRQALEQIDRLFGGALTAQVLVAWDEGLQLSSPLVLSALTEAQEVCRRHPGAHNPLSILNVLDSFPDDAGTAVDRAARLAWVPDDVLAQFVRRDLRKAVITAHLEDLGSAVHVGTFDSLSRDLEQVAAAHPGVHLSLTGTTVLASRNLNQMIFDLAQSLGSAAAIIFVAMAIGFRSLRLGLISVLPNLFPLVVTAALLVASGQPLQMTSVIVFSICLGIAVNDTIHFISRFQHEVAVDGDVPAAITRAFRTVGSAMITTSAVLVAGFASVMISEMPTSRLFGGLSCLAIIAALVGDLLILPPLLACFARPPARCTAATAADCSLAHRGSAPVAPPLVVADV